MFSLRSDEDGNVLHMRFASDVTLDDLGHVERAVVVAARSLEGGFALVADVRECDSITRSAAERVRAAVQQSVAFGLAGVVSVVGEDTPPGIERTIRRVAEDAGADVRVVDDWDPDGATR